MVRRVISQETKAKAYPGVLKKTKIETAFSRARQESKDHSIHYSTILYVSLFKKSGENSNVNKRKTQSRIQRTLTTKVIIHISPAVSNFYGTKYENKAGFGLVGTSWQ